MRFLLLLFLALPAYAEVLFNEPFENDDFEARGWYDSTGGTIDTGVAAPGSTASFNCHWNNGGTTCSGGTPQRHEFTATQTLAVSFWLKLGAAGNTWVGSGATYHPHLFQFLTDADGPFVGPNSALFSALIETHVFTPRLAMADSMAINVTAATSTPGAGANLLASTTAHAVAGCNGSQNGSAQCYACPPPDYPNTGAYCNGTFWDAAAPAFVNDTWAFVETYFQMNTVTGSTPNADGIMRMWVDGVQVVNITNAYFLSGQNPARAFDKLILAPYMGDGSPKAQDLWIDNLTIATSFATAPTYMPIRQ